MDWEPLTAVGRVDGCSGGGHWCDRVRCVADDDYLVAVGSTREVEREVKKRWISTDAVCLSPGLESLVCPGFTDSHAHVSHGGKRLAELELSGCMSLSEMQERIRLAVKADAWVTGGGWDENLWGGELPTRELLDAVAPDTPVFLYRLDGHSAVANTAALRLAGLAGHSGVVREAEMAVVERFVPPPTRDDTHAAIDRGMAHLLAHGITSAHVMCLDRADWDGLMGHGEGAVRLYVSGPLMQWRVVADEVARRGYGTRKLRIGAVKGFADGSLGSRTAAFFEEYTDGGKEAPFEFRLPAIDAAHAGLQLCIHAIGDAGIHEVLNVIERCPRNLRHRIEHSQHPMPSDVPRFGRLGVVASMQPAHIKDDARSAESVLGRERCLSAFPFRSLLRSGAVLAFGSDWPVAPVDVPAAIAAACTRIIPLDATANTERISRAQALRAFTAGPAYASFDEGLKGTLEHGKLADFVVLDRDVLRHDGAKVTTTVVGGSIVYER